MIRSDSTPSIRSKTPSEFSITQPILETLLLEIREVAKSVNSIQLHLDQQDLKIANLSAQINLAGNLAGEAADQATLALSEIRQVKSIVSKMDQTLFGVTELAKSGFDIATAIRSVAETDRPSAIDDFEGPILEIAEF